MLIRKRIWCLSALFHILVLKLLLWFLAFRDLWDGDKMPLLKLWETPCVAKVSPAVFELGCFINYCGIASLAGLRIRWTDWTVCTNLSAIYSQWLLFCSKLLLIHVTHRKTFPFISSHSFFPSTLWFRWSIFLLITFVPVLVSGYLIS